MEQASLHFRTEGTPVSCERYGCGHINETYLVVTDARRRYILQKISRRAFPDVDGLMENIAAVTRFLAARTDDPRGAMSACGMPEGKYALGGQAVYVKNGLATLENGTIAGAASDLYTDFLNAVRFGIPPEDAVRAATWNPACEIGRQREIGSIEAGKCADFVVCAEDFRRLAVYIDGVRADGKDGGTA